MGVPITINNKEYAVPEGLTILQACEHVGVQIPRFCYHEKLSIAGNCRMCLVHLEKSVKPVASCAITVAPGMKIFTDTSFVRRAREGVMEFLLANHPLDCPICDQGGECDLQDQALFFGNDRGRFYERKRAVSDKNCGPLIKTIMTRCIHCTRCVRFSQELSGLAELTTTGRGSGTEIGNYVSKSLKSSVSGNLIDLCPVGALTSKPYAFRARSWELKRRETIDTLDSMGSNISVQSFGREVMRILPVMHEGLNQEWINDRSRFSYDSMKSQRILSPLFREGDLLKKCSWDKSLNLLCYFFSSLNQTHVKQLILGNEVSLEVAFLLKKIMQFQGQKISTVSGHLLSNFNIDFRSNYLFNSTFSNFEKADSFLVIGVDLNQEMPLLLLRLRRKLRRSFCSVGFLGLPSDYGFNGVSLGNTSLSVAYFLEGRHRFCTVLRTSFFPLIIVGNSIVESVNYDLLIPSFQKIKCLKKLGWMGLNFLHAGANRVGLLDLGFSNTLRFEANTKTLSVESDSLLPKDAAQSIYFGSHGFSKLKDFFGLFPSLTSLEKEASYVNAEGRAQQTQICLSTKIRKEEDILSSFQFLFQEVFASLESAKAMRIGISHISNLLYNRVGYSSFSCIFSKKGHLEKYLLGSSWANFYMINTRTQISQNMVNCLKNVNLSKNRIYKI